jgi:trk system potassium uptake protein TrkA
LFVTGLTGEGLWALFHAVREIFSERLTMLPHADFTIEDSDVLVVIGKKKDIQRIK